MELEERKQRFIDAYVASMAGSHAAMVVAGRAPHPTERQQSGYFGRLKTAGDYAWRAYANYMDLPDATESA